MFKQCIVCKKQFNKSAKEGFQDWNKRKFCSPKCYYSYQKLHPNKGTFKNGNHPKSEFKKGHPKPKNAYTFPAGEKHPRWKGKINRQKYIYLYLPKHPFCSKDNYYAEHRLIAEKILNRFLTKIEIIHHINKIKDDNRSENLYLFSSCKEHAKFHHLKKPPMLISNLNHQ